MKRFIVFILLIALTLSLASCTGVQVPDPNEPTEEEYIAYEMYMDYLEQQGLENVREITRQEYLDLTFVLSNELYKSYLDTDLYYAYSSIYSDIDFSTLLNNPNITNEQKEALHHFYMSERIKDELEDFALFNMALDNVPYKNYYDAVHYLTPIGSSNLFNYHKAYNVNESIDYTINIEEKTISNLQTDPTMSRDDAIDYLLSTTYQNINLEVMSYEDNLVLVTKTIVGDEGDEYPIYDLVILNEDSYTNLEITILEPTFVVINIRYVEPTYHITDSVNNIYRSSLDLSNTSLAAELRRGANSFVDNPVFTSDAILQYEHDKLKEVFELIANVVQESTLITE